MTFSNRNVLGVQCSGNTTKKVSQQAVVLNTLFMNFQREEHFHKRVAMQ